MAVRERPRLVTGARLWWQQLGALTWKNFVIRLRSWKTNALLLTQAVLFVFLIWGVDKAITNSRQRQPAYQSLEVATPEALTSVPDCINNIFLREGQPCYSFLYSPADSPVVERIVAAVIGNNNPPIPPERVLALGNSTLVDEYLLQHPETVLASVSFSVDSATSVGFEVQTNSSVQWFKGNYQNPNTYIQMPLQAAVEREIVRLLAQEPALGWDVDITAFPHPASHAASRIGSIAPTFLFASIMFQFVLLVHDVVEEKEGGMRRAMATMGLREGPFWASWILLQGMLFLLEAILLEAFSYAFGFKLFTANAFGLSFTLLLLVNLAMMSFGFMVAAMLQTASAAVPVGFLVFVIGWIFLIVIAFGFPYSTKYGSAAIAIFSLFPWSLLSKGIQDLAAAAENRSGGIPLVNLFGYCQANTPNPATLGVLAELGYWEKDCVMPLGQIYWVLALQIVGYLGLAYYLDSVLPDSYGVCRPPWFLLQPGYWTRQKKHSVRGAARALAAPTELQEGVVVDPDVQQETDSMRMLCQQHISQYAHPTGRSWFRRRRGVAAESGAAAAPEPQLAMSKAARCGEQSSEQEAAAAGGEEQRYAVEMFGLRKVFRTGRVPFRKKEFVAVRGNWLGIREGECFCLLGPNGAGKSTTINCLTGVIPFSGGDALVYGESISSVGGMDAARPLMGVCPQFDVLLAQLTGREHLLLFGAIKGLPLHDARVGAISLLEEVKLLEAGSVRAGAYSGGMKRRLSVAIALLGDPKVVYLDEPTTGLDPISRRHLWDLVDRCKRDRAIILTTHSMEEADVLGDRIGIMARGRLRCLGTALRLKARFGSGYRISIRVRGSGGVDGTGTAAGLQQGHGMAWKPLAASLSPAASPRVDLRADGRSQASQGEISAPTASVASDMQPYEPGQAPDAPHRRDGEATRQMEGIRDLFMQRLGIKSVDESLDYLHFLVPYEHEDQLPLLLAFLKAHADSLGVADVQLRLTPLEEVFLTVTRKAELEHAQASGHSETLVIAEENIAIKVPVGADFIQSPAGHLYHIKWVQDETGQLKLHDYHRDPVSSAVLSAEGGAGDADGASIVATAGGSQASLASGAAVVTIVAEH